MADNLPLKNDAATTIGTVATDDVAGVHYPISKLAFGALDTATLVTGAVGLPIADAGGSITVDGSVSITGAVDTELTTADLDTGAGTDTRAVVGLVLAASGGGLLVGSANPLPVSDNGGTLSIDDGGAAITVDGTVAISGTVTVDHANAAEADYDTGAGNVNQVMFGIAVPASGGPVAGGTAANPLRTDPTGTTTQPVSGTVTVVDGGGAISIDDGGGAITVDGTVAATQSGTWTVQPGNTPNTTPWLTSDRPATAGGLATHKTVSAASTNATSVKAAAGQLYDLFVSNINAAARYLKLYDKASAPVVGTDVPKLTLLIPGNTAGAGFSKHIPTGIEFTAGIAFALTTGAADADTGAVAAAELLVNLGYK